MPPAMVEQIAHGRLVPIPASLSTHGDGTRTWVVNWKGCLLQLLPASGHPTAPPDKAS